MSDLSQFPDLSQYQSSLTDAFKHVQEDRKAVDEAAKKEKKFGTKTIYVKDEKGIHVEKVKGLFRRLSAQQKQASQTAKAELQAKLKTDTEKLSEQISKCIEKLNTELEHETDADKKKAIQNLFFNVIAKFSDDVLVKAYEAIVEDSALEKLLAEGTGGKLIQARREHELAIKKAEEQEKAIEEFHRADLHGKMEAGEFITKEERDKRAERKAKELEQARIKHANLISDALLKLIEVEGEFAIKLGVKPVETGEGERGVSVSYFVRDITGKKIAVFKPEDLGPRSKYNPRVGIGAKIADKLFRSIRQEAQPVAEVASAAASRSIGALNVPPTKITAVACDIFENIGKPLKLKKGSLQAYVPGCVDAKSFFGVKKGTDEFKSFLQSFVTYVRSDEFRHQLAPGVTPEQVIANVKKIAGLLYAFCVVGDHREKQIDRHFENLLVFIPQGPDEKPEKRRIALCMPRLFKLDENGYILIRIDNGAAYPKGHVEKSHELRNYNLVVELSGSETLVSHLPPFPKDWDKKGLQAFLDASLKEDLAPLGRKGLHPEQLRNVTTQVSSAINRILERKKGKDGRIDPMPTEAEILIELRSRIKYPEFFSEEDLSRLSQTVLQALGLLDSDAVLKCFLNPPKGHEKEFTLSRLSRVALPEEVRRFWRFYDSLKVGEKQS